MTTYLVLRRRRRRSGSWLSGLRGGLGVRCRVRMRGLRGGGRGLDILVHLFQLGEAALARRTAAMPPPHAPRSGPTGLSFPVRRQRRRRRHGEASVPRAALLDREGRVVEIHGDLVGLCASLLRGCSRALAVGRVAARPLALLCSTARSSATGGGCASFPYTKRRDTSPTPPPLCSQLLSSSSFIDFQASQTASSSARCAVVPLRRRAAASSSAAASGTFRALRFCGFAAQRSAMFRHGMCYDVTATATAVPVACLLRWMQAHAAHAAR